MQKNTRTHELALIGLVTAAYVAISMLLPGMQYGAVQLRLAEGFNHLAIFSKKYIVAVSLGVLLVNLNSPLGLVDMVFGTLGTVSMMTMTYYATRYIRQFKLKLVMSTVIDVIMMWVVALELHLVLGLPFWPTYLWVAVGELMALIIGAVVLYAVRERLPQVKGAHAE